MANPIERFNELAEAYEQFTDTMPNHGRMNEIILEFFHHYAGDHPLEAIAELGCGTGTMARTLVEEYGPKDFLAVDGAEEMLKQARETFGDYEGETEIEFQQEDFADWSPEQSYDLLLSSLAIHHLSDTDKWKLFERIAGRLKPGGLFLYADIFQPEPEWESLFKEIHWERRRQLGMSENEIEACWQSHKENDRPARLRETLVSLQSSGFTGVELLWSNLNRAVIISKKD